MITREKRDEYDRGEKLYKVAIISVYAHARVNNKKLISIITNSNRYFSLVVHALCTLRVHLIIFTHYLSKKKKNSNKYC